MTDPAFLLALVAALLGGASLVLHVVAPRTKTTIDDQLRDDIDEVLAWWRGRQAGIVPGPAAKPASAPPGTGTAAMLAVLLLGALAAPALTGCAATASTVRTEAVTLEGCSAADAVAIVTASAKIVDDVKATDHVTAAIDAIGQLATIHAAWSRCKGAAPPTVPPVPAASSAS
jgi:hypothetical protein